MTATEQFINVLTNMKTGELGLLRTHAGQGLDESLDGFDLFSGLWWPLRQQNERAPRREVAWMIAKLYACRPVPHSPGDTLARRLRQCQPNKEPDKERFRQRFDRMLILPLGKIEPALRWALGQIASNNGKLDWVKLTDNLSQWERETTRLEWAEQFLGTDEKGTIMLIEIHAIQNHSPANMNRDDLGAPKTCYFGGVLRSRISSQCIKRSIRMSDGFKLLCGGIRTRRLPQYLAEQIDDRDVLSLATTVIQKCGLLRNDEQGKKKDVIVFLSKSAAARMLDMLRREPLEPNATQLENLARQFAELIARDRYAPDMALSGRMLEPAKPPKKGKKGKADDTNEQEDDEVADEEKGKNKGLWKDLDLSIEAALQVSHAISTHEARPEVDYFVAKDDVVGEDSGGAHLGEAMYASACFYKYFSINWDKLVENLNANKELAAHTVGAFIRGVAQVNPTGKQNSFAAHNPPDGMLVEIKGSPISYANAFAKPTVQGERDIISQSIAQLGQYIHDLDVGYGKPQQRFWFSPNLRYALSVVENKQEIVLAEHNVKSLDELIPAAIKAIDAKLDWTEVQKQVVNLESVS